LIEAVVIEDRLAADNPSTRVRESRRVAFAFVVEHSGAQEIELRSVKNEAIDLAVVQLNGSDSARLMKLADISSLQSIEQSGGR